MRKDFTGARRALVAPALGLLAAVGAMTGAAQQAQAQADVMELHTVTGEQGKLLVAVSPGGVTFINPRENQPFRSFKATRKTMRGYEPDWFIIRDVDNNGTVDVIGAGKPAYIIDGGGAPMYSITNGCDQFHLGDFAADKSQDILCRNGNKITAFTHDGQLIWEFNVRGVNIGVCNFGDLNGDLKDDIECEVKGKGVMRLNGVDGSDMGNREEAQLEGPQDDSPGYADQMANTLAGQELFDLNGDGTEEESVLLDGTALVIRSKANPKAIARHEVGKVFSVLVDDLNEDGKLEIAVGGQGKVFIIDAAGALVATIPTDPGKLKRKTDVQVEVNANGLEDSDPASVRASVDKGMGKIAACYDGNVKRDPFTRVGRTIWALYVDDKGKVKKVERYHSALADKKVEDCLTKALKGLSFSKGTSPDAVVTTTLIFGFVDQ